MNWRPLQPHIATERHFRADSHQVGISVLLETVERLRGDLARSERQRHMTAVRLAMQERENSLWRKRFHALLAAKQRRRTPNDRQMMLL